MCVRKRPLTRTECKRGETDVLTTPSEECVIVHESKEAVDLTQYILKVDIKSRYEAMSETSCWKKTAFSSNKHFIIKL